MKKYREKEFPKIFQQFFISLYSIRSINRFFSLRYGTLPAFYPIFLIKLKIFSEANDWLKTTIHMIHGEMCMAFLIYGIHNLCAVINFIRNKRKKSKRKPLFSRRMVKRQYKTWWNLSKWTVATVWALCKLGWQHDKNREIIISVLDAAHTLQRGIVVPFFGSVCEFFIANSFEKKTNSNAYGMNCCARFIDFQSEIDVRKIPNVSSFFRRVNIMTLMAFA